MPSAASPRYRARGLPNRSWSGGDAPKRSGKPSGNQFAPSSRARGRPAGPKCAWQREMGEVVAHLPPSGRSRTITSRLRAVPSTSPRALQPPSRLWWPFRIHPDDIFACFAGVNLARRYRAHLREQVQALSSGPRQRQTTQSLRRSLPGHQSAAIFQKSAAISEAEPRIFLAPRRRGISPYRGHVHYKDGAPHPGIRSESSAGQS